tara:strand:+ start:2403 stop:3110 length:708 start_codon:yes stop_codon:yes gene_type:complete
MIHRGIYRIDTTKAEYYYIGGCWSKAGFNYRVSVHLSAFRKGKHHNKFLQHVFNKYGEDSILFTLIEDMSKSSDEEIQDREEQLLVEAVKDPNCTNVSTRAYGGFTTAHKSPKERAKSYRKMVKSMPWKERNKRHSKTLQNKTDEDWDIIAEKLRKTRKRNRKQHKSYKPMSVTFQIPGKSKTTKVFESEADFMSSTNFENTTICKLKRTKTHTVKRILPDTKHSYPKGTVLTLL